MSPNGPVLIASADRLFAEAAAHFIQRHTGLATITEGDGVRALMTVARVDPSAVLMLGSLERIPAEAFARRLRARWPSIRLIVLGSSDEVGAGSLPGSAGGASVLAALEASTGPSGPSPDERDPDELARLQSLTKQERRVLVLIGQGMEPRAIAERLSISEHTVRTHLQHLHRKLDVHSRLEIVRLVARHGLLRGAAGQPE